MSQDNLPHPHLHDHEIPDQSHVRGTFAGKLGFILAAAGSAVGLGNIWRFPYLTGENGGSAFILVYLISIVLVGMPVMLAEFIIGRATQTDQVSAYTAIKPGKPWCLNGLMGLLSGVLILSFYCPVAGWVLAYGCKMALGMFHVTGMTDAQMAEYFTGQTAQLFAGGWDGVVWMLIIMAATSGIIFFGVETGIERACKVLMPALFVLMLIITLRSLTLGDGVGEGLAFLFKPQWDKINGPVVLDAMTQAFFTLSLAMGAMMTYASYVKPDVHLGRMVLSITALDTGVALLAGLMIFPAVFAFDMTPAQGPTLVFNTLPVVFMKMHMGRLIGTAFFGLLTIAAVTSTISLLEPVVTWFVDGLQMDRFPATAMALVIVMVLGIPVSQSVTGDGWLSLSYGLGADKASMPLFDVMDFATTKLFMPVGGIVICLFIAFGWKRSAALKEAVGTMGTPGIILHIWYWLTITLTPLLILLVMLSGLGVIDLLVEKEILPAWFASAPKP